MGRVIKGKSNGSLAGLVIHLAMILPVIWIFVASAARAESIEALIERRNGYIELLSSTIEEVEKYTQLAYEERIGVAKDNFGTWREEVLKEKLDDIEGRREASRIVFRPEFLRNFRPHPLLLVVYEGFALGWSIGEVIEAMKIAGIYDAQVEADLQRIVRINRQITDLDLRIAQLYREQAQAQLTLMAGADIPSVGVNSDYGPGFVSNPLNVGPNAPHFTMMSCEYAARVDPSEFGCASWSQTAAPSATGSQICACVGVPRSVAVQPQVPPEVALDDLRSGPLGMTDELASEVVSFCAANPSALTCLPPSEASRFGAYCEGPNRAPDCASPFSAGRLGGYCDGPNPLPDCLPTSGADQ